MKSNLHNVLRELREERKMKQYEVAVALGVSQVTYSNYELGKREPDIETLIALADYFSVPIDLLVGRYVRRKENIEE